MSIENKRNCCLDCEGVFCTDLGGGKRLLASVKNNIAYTMGEPVDECAIKTDKQGIERKLTEDAVWDATTDLKGLKKHQAFAKRIYDGRQDETT